MNTDEHYLRLALKVARQARVAGNHPFGAILVGPDGTVLMEAGNAHGNAGDRTGHAERVLMTRASMAYTADFLAMRDVRRFGVLGWGRPRCLWPVRARPGPAYRPASGEPDDGSALPHVLGAGQRLITVVGPLLEAESRAVHEGFWR